MPKAVDAIRTQNETRKKINLTPLPIPSAQQQPTGVSPTGVSPIVSISAMKKSDQGDSAPLERCSMNDPNAILFQVSYRGAPNNEPPLSFTNLSMAQHVGSALHQAFQTGSNQRALSIRQALGVKEINLT
jgi:hypothetical protein